MISDLFFGKNEVFFPEKVHENSAEEKCRLYEEFQDPGLWGSEELTELSHISLCKRKAIEWLVLFEPWELAQTSVCFWMYGVLCAVSTFSLDWRDDFYFPL